MSQSNQSGQNCQSNQRDLNSQSKQKGEKITFLPQHGHYRHLRVYQVTEMIYDITYYFAQHYLSKGDRTVDQMVQAARSGKQNIAEGNQAAATSSETEIKLTNVAKASLEELLDDYEDYLRVRKLEQWGSMHPRYEKMRQYAQSDKIKKEYAKTVQRLNDEEIANLCITLIHQAIYMLHKLLQTMQDRFVKEGGIKERMYQSRVEYRSNQSNQSNQSNRSNQKNRRMMGRGIKNFDYSEECTNFAEKDITNNKEDMKRFLTKVWGILAMLTLLTTGSKAHAMKTGENALAMKTDERIQIPLIGNVPGRQGMTLNGDWQYIVDVQEEGYYDYRMKENRWGFFLNAKPQRPEDLIEYDFDKSETMRVPGDWNTQDPRLFFYEGCVWLKRDFHYEKQIGKRALLHFGAVNYEAVVYVNGKKAGRHEGGFTGFCFDVTNLLHDGNNFVVVKVDNKRKAENVPTLIFDWWNYGGITRRCHPPTVALHRPPEQPESR